MIEPSKQLQAIFDSSVSIAQKYTHTNITIEHLVCAIFSDTETAAGLQEFGADVDFIKTNLEHYLKNNLADITSNDPQIVPKKNCISRTCFK